MEDTCSRCGVCVSVRACVCVCLKLKNAYETCKREVRSNLRAHLPTNAAVQRCAGLRESNVNTQFLSPKALEVLRAGGARPGLVCMYACVCTNDSMGVFAICVVTLV
jgi:hypothetical protein